MRCAVMCDHGCIHVSHRKRSHSILILWSIKYHVCSLVRQRTWRLKWRPRGMSRTFEHSPLKLSCSSLPQSARSAEFDRHTWARCNIHTWMTSSHLAFAGRSRDPSNWTQAPRPLDRPRPSALHAWDLNSLTIDKKTVFFKTQVMISIIDHMSVLSVFLSVLCRISVLIRIR